MGGDLLYQEWVKILFCCESFQKLMNHILYRARNIVLIKSNMSFRFSILSSDMNNFRLKTVFLPIKPEVGVILVWGCHKPKVSGVSWVDWGVNHCCRTTSGFTGNESSDRKSDIISGILTPNYTWRLIDIKSEL